MQTALWDNLAVEVCHLLKEPDVFEQRRTPLAGCCDVLVVVDGGAECCGELLIHIVLSVVLRVLSWSGNGASPIFDYARNQLLEFGNGSSQSDRRSWGSFNRG